MGERSGFICAEILEQLHIYGIKKVLNSSWKQKINY